MLLDLPQSRGGDRLFRAALRHLCSEADEKAKAVLEVSKLRVRNEPVPVKIRVLHEDPWQRFGDARVKVVPGDGIQDQASRVDDRTRPEMAIPWVTERRQLADESVRVGLHPQRFGRHRQDCRRQSVDLHRRPRQADRNSQPRGCPHLRQPRSHSAKPQLLGIHCPSSSVVI